MHFIKKAKTNILLFALFSMLMIELPIISNGYWTTPQSSDVIIVLGAKLIGSEPSTILQFRLEKAISLYQENYASTIIVSGAQGRDELVSEASAMREYLIARGLAPERILIEDHSFNTYQNLAYSQIIMKEHGLKSAIIVSNRSHIYRALLLAQRLGIEASGAAAPMPANAYLTTKQYLREGAAIVSLMQY